MKEIIYKLIELILKMFKAEHLIWEELKLEAHINSMLVQLLELASQLSDAEYNEIITNLHSQDDEIDLTAYLVK